MNGGIADRKAAYNAKILSVMGSLHSALLEHTAEATRIKAEVAQLQLVNAQMAGTIKDNKIRIKQLQKKLK